MIEGWNRQRQAIVANLHQASDDFVLVDVKNYTIFAQQWTQFSEKFEAMCHCLTHKHSLPKRNKKEYAGSARAEKEALSEQRMAACREFLSSYEASYSQLHNSWRSEYVEVSVFY